MTGEDIPEDSIEAAYFEEKDNHDETEGEIAATQDVKLEHHTKINGKWRLALTAHCISKLRLYDRKLAR